MVELALGWKHVQESDRLHMHRSRACLRHHYEMQRNCCIRIHRGWLAFRLSDIDRKRRLNFVNWYLHCLDAGEVEPHARTV